MLVDPAHFDVSYVINPWMNPAAWAEDPAGHRRQARTSFESLAAIHDHVAPSQRLEASREDAAAFCVNAVNIGQDVVMAQAPAHVRTLLQERGYRVHDVDLSPFILSGGGAYCMTLRLDRRSERK